MVEETKEETKKEAPPPALIKVGDRTYNLLDAFPMTLGDWEDMNELGVMDGSKLVMVKPKQMLDLLHMLLHKVDPNIERAAIRHIPVREMPDLTNVLRYILDLEEKQTENPTTAS